MKSNANQRALIMLREADDLGLTTAQLLGLLKTDGFTTMTEPLLALVLTDLTDVRGLVTAIDDDLDGKRHFLSNKGKAWLAQRGL